jgi:hypothetical protein
MDKEAPAWRAPSRAVARRRAIGSSKETKAVQNSGKNYGTDGVGYNLFT